jgi:hypothetical protein
MRVAVIPIGILVWRGPTMEAVVAYEAASSILVMTLIPPGRRRYVGKASEGWGA